MKQGNLKNTKPKDIEKKQKRDTVRSINAFYEGREMVLTALKNGILPIQPVEGTGRPGMLPLCPLDVATRFKTLTPNKCFKNYQ